MSIMFSLLTKSRFPKYAIFLIVLSLFVVYIYFYNTIDDFLPKHLARISDVVANGILESEKVIQTPAYYIFGSIICILLGVDAISLLWAPVTLVPLFLFLYLFFYYISKNKTISFILSFINLVSGTTSSSVYFWPHGLGFILFLGIQLCLLHILLKNTYNLRMMVLLLLQSLILVYMSYNNIAKSGIILLILIVLIIIYQLKLSGSRIKIFNSQQIKIILVSAIISILFIFGLSIFWDEVFIQTILHFLNDGSQLSIYDKFVAMFLSDGSSASVNEGIISLIATTPITNTVLAAIKYGFCGITVFIYLIFIISKTGKDDFGAVDVYLLSVILMTFFYLGIRLFIGNLALTEIWIPGLLCLCRLYSVSSVMNRLPLKSICICISIILLLVTLSQICVYLEYDYMSRDIEKYDAYRSSYYYIRDYGGVNYLYSDEMTVDMLYLFAVSDKDKVTTTDEAKYKYSLINSNQVLHLIGLTNLHGQTGYIVTNDIRSRMSLQNWIIIDKWDNKRDNIDFNANIIKVYRGGATSVYFS